MTSKRQLAAIMFTDITGFSAMMQSSESYAKTILKRHREVFRSAHTKYDGKILQFFGDGTLSIFDSAAAAVECAVDMQIELRKSPEVPLRIGIHTGDITYDDNGAFGDGLNIASRVERLCIPGAVYITAKVFDDIKNHSWLSAISLGFFQLRNISNEMELYAVTSKGLALPEKQDIQSYPEYGRNQKETEELERPVGRKSKWVTALLAIMFGTFGIHRLYLGQRVKGILWFAMAIIGILVTVEEGFPLIAIVGGLAFFDGILFAVMPRADFDNRYNYGIKAPKTSRKSRKIERDRIQKSDKKLFEPIKQGIRLFEKGHYHKAIQYFDQILAKDRDNIIAHYYLACCFSIMRDKEDAFFHLSKAVEYGFDDFNRIDEEEAFWYIRSLPDYQVFVNNNYTPIATLPTPKPDLLDDKFNPEVLEKIELLGDLLEKGDLSREEFELRKQKILRNED